jgi:hypothetical protein
VISGEARIILRRFDCWGYWILVLARVNAENNTQDSAKNYHDYQRKSELAAITPVQSCVPSSKWWQLYKGHADQRVSRGCQVRFFQATK